MNGELTITMLAEKMDLKKAMRIHFAGMIAAALAGANRAYDETFNAGIFESNDRKDGRYRAIAPMSVWIADALIAELEKGDKI